MRCWLLPSTGRISLSWLVRVSLFACFLIAFTQYELSVAITGYLALGALGFAGLMVLCGNRRAERVQNILGGGGLLFAAILFGEVISYTSHDTYSQLYGLLFIGIFFCARLIVQEIGISNVIRAYSQAAIATVCILLISGRQSITSAQQVRFSGGTHAHPNLLGFVMAGYFPVIVWRAMEEKVGWRKKALILLSAGYIRDALPDRLTWQPGGSALCRRGDAGSWGSPGMASKSSAPASAHHCFRALDPVGGDVPVSAQPGGADWRFSERFPVIEQQPARAEVWIVGTHRHLAHRFSPSWRSRKMAVRFWLPRRRSHGGHH